MNTAIDYFLKPGTGVMGVANHQTISASDWTSLHDRLHKTIRHRKLFEKGQSILIAVSGGQDSLCLAKLMRDLQPKWQWQLAIAHCDHRWAIDSPELPAHVRSVAASLDLPFFLATAPDEVADDNREATARRWRYQALKLLATSHGFQTITTGHTASDRAETLLYNLMRGSGMDGLSALGWARELSTEITLVRPILNVTRAETQKFCTQIQLPVWDDPANQDLNYARNRIRQEVIPYMTQHFNPNLEQTLATTAEILDSDVAYLEAEAEKIFQHVVEHDVSLALQSKQELTSYQSENVMQSFRINRRILQLQPLSLQRRVIRRCLSILLPKAPTFIHIEKLTELILAPNRTQTDPFPGGAIAYVANDWILFKTSN